MYGSRNARVFVSLIAAVVLLLAAVPGPARSGERVALVIGNSAYAHAPALAGPLNDATDIGAALGRLGFAVTGVENADQGSLRRSLRDFASRASSSEMAIVFYAGHAVSVDKRNFLVPVDARLSSVGDVEFESVPLELVERTVARASSLRLIVLDACRENPLAVSMRRTGAARSIGGSLSRAEPSAGTLIAYASKEETACSKSPGRNSAFSTALLRHLEEPGVEVGAMFHKVREAVQLATGGRQEPVLYGSVEGRSVYLGAAPQASSGSVAASPSTESGPDMLAAEKLAAERLYWQSVKDSGDTAEIQTYLDQYPSGTYAALARARVKRLNRAAGSASPAPGPAAEAPSPAVRRRRLRRYPRSRFPPRQPKKSKRRWDCGAIFAA